MNRGDLIAATIAGEQSPVPINELTVIPKETTWLPSLSLRFCFTHTEKASSEVNSTTATKVTWELEIKFLASHQPRVTSSIMTFVTMTMDELQLQVQRFYVSS